MLGLGALLALELTTSTPDALCPPLEEARAAVKARLGEVEGAYRAEFALIRAEDGRQSLELLVHEGDTLKLRRSLPLEGFGCEDAAQAIALVLERYFDTVESSTRPAEQKPEPVPVAAEPSAPVAVAAPRAAAPKEQALARERRWQVRLGPAYDWELGLAVGLGASYFPSALRLNPRWSVGVALDGAAFLGHVSETAREQEVSASTLQMALSLPLSCELGRVSLGIGPWAQLRLQRAYAPTLAGEGAAHRALPGLGGTLLSSWGLSSAWRLNAGVAFGGQLSGASSRFVLRQTANPAKPVLVPQGWFGQAWLAVALAL